MNLDDVLLTCFSWIDEMIPGVTPRQRLWQRGPMPGLRESEVLTMDVVGSDQGSSQDEALFAFFQEHDVYGFPGLSHMHCLTFVRHAANLWTIKERVWVRLCEELIRHDKEVGRIASMLLPVCRCARVPWGVRFRGPARSGNDHAERQTCDGLRGHLHPDWPGVITHMALAYKADREIAPVVLEGTPGLVLRNRHDGVPDLQASRRKGGLVLHAPFRNAHSLQAPVDQNPVLGQVCSRIGPVFGQRTDRCKLKRVWACNLWHLRHRILHVFWMHTLCVWLHQHQEAPCLHLDRLVAAQLARGMH